MCIMTFIGGTIPSGLCSTTGFNINVTNTNIHCYSGCLTSSAVIIEGATHICPDGSIMERFVIVVGVCGSVCVLATVWYKYIRKSVNLSTEAEEKFEQVSDTVIPETLSVTLVKYSLLI